MMWKSVMAAGAGNFNAAIISGHPAGFTHWVRVNLPTTRGGAGFARKRSRVQDIIKDVKTCASAMMNAYIKELFVLTRRLAASDHPRRFFAGMPPCQSSRRQPIDRARVCDGA